MFDNIEFEEAKINLKRGDRLYFYTDGIPEAKGPNGDLFQRRAVFLAWHCCHVPALYRLLCLDSHYVLGDDQDRP